MVAIEFECRFWFPDRFGHNDNRWGWQRHREIVHMQLPSSSGSWYTAPLPPPMFSYNAASLIRFELNRTEQGDGPFAQLQIDGWRVFYGIPFTESKLWTQVKFQIPWYDKTGFTPEHDTWWLRWRCPNAEHDIMSLVKTTLEDIHANADQPEMVKLFTQQLNREIVMNALGGTLPDRIVKFKHE